MPFTGSHPAAVLPFLRLGLPAPCLVIGSIAPDLPMFVPMPVSIDQSHSLLGVVTVDLALGLLAYWAWQALLWPGLVMIMPDGVRVRLPTRASSSPPHSLAGRVGAVLLAIVIGALTHVVWDAFTHKQMWGPQHLSLLARQYGPLATYDWAQHVSSAGGLVILALWFRSWYRKTTPVPGADPMPPRGAVIGRTLLALAVASGTTYGLVVGLRETPRSLEAVLFHVVTRGGLAAIAGLAASGLIARSIRHRLSNVVGTGRP